MPRVDAPALSVGNLGIATEYGFGRRPQDSLPELFRIRREAAAAL